MRFSTRNWSRFVVFTFNFLPKLAVEDRLSHSLAVMWMPNKPWSVWTTWTPMSRSILGMAMSVALEATYPTTETWNDDSGDDENDAGDREGPNVVDGDSNDDGDPLVVGRRVRGRGHGRGHRGGKCGRRGRGSGGGGRGRGHGRGVWLSQGRGEGG